MHNQSRFSSIVKLFKKFDVYAINEIDKNNKTCTFQESVNCNSHKNKIILQIIRVSE